MAVGQPEVVDVLEVLGEVVSPLELVLAEVAAVDGALLQVGLLHVHDHCAAVPGAEVTVLVLAKLLVGRTVDQDVLAQILRSLAAVVAKLARVEFDVRMLGKRERKNTKYILRHNLMVPCKSCAWLAWKAWCRSCRSSGTCTR